MSDPYDIAPDPDEGAARPAGRMQPQYSSAFAPPQAVYPGGATLGYAGPRTYYGAPLPNGWRATTAFYLALVLAVLNLLTLGVDAMDYQQFGQAEAGTLTVEEEQHLIATAIALAGIYLVVAIVFLVFFFMWLYRSVKNVRITTGDSRSGPGMSVGWWFIPIANLFMPYLVLKDLWERVRVGSSPAVVGVFWFLWIISGLAARATDRAYTGAVEVGDFDLARTMLLIGATSSVASAAAYGLLALIVRKIQLHQEPA